MASPTLDDFLSSCARWRGEHNDIGYELSWHGRSEFQPKGIWCWYLLLREEQFYPEDWARLRMERQDRDFAGHMHRHWNYDAFPDLEPHGGWTFGEMTVYLGRDGKEYEFIKVGCDYNHLWDKECGYWQGRADIERDVHRSIDLLCAMFPRRRPRCRWSGRYDDPENFYTARGGWLIHRDYLDRFKNEQDNWAPADASAAESWS